MNIVGAMQIHMYAVGNYMPMCALTYCSICYGSEQRTANTNVNCDVVYERLQSSAFTCGLT